MLQWNIDHFLKKAHNLWLNNEHVLRIIRNLLLSKCMIVLQVSLNLDPVKEILKITTMSHLYFNEESDYSEENACYK